MPREQPKVPVAVWTWKRATLEFSATSPGKIPGRTCSMRPETAPALLLAPRRRASMSCFVRPFRAPRIVVIPRVCLASVAVSGFSGLPGQRERRSRRNRPVFGLRGPDFPPLGQDTCSYCSFRHCVVSVRVECAAHDRLLEIRKIGAVHTSRAPWSWPVVWVRRIDEHCHPWGVAHLLALFEEIIRHNDWPWQDMGVRVGATICDSSRWIMVRCEYDRHERPYVNNIKLGLDRRTPRF